MYGASEVGILWGQRPLRGDFFVWCVVIIEDIPTWLGDWVTPLGDFPSNHFGDRGTQSNFADQGYPGFPTPATSRAETLLVAK